MPRRILIRTSDHPYHVTTRCHNRDWFALPLENVWDICLDAFEHALTKADVELMAFVLMSNHYHLLLKTPNRNLDVFMKHFNEFLSRKIKSETNVLNQKFGGRYKWSLIESETYFYNVIRYIFQNPVRAGICKRVEEYPFSTATDKTYAPRKRIGFDLKLGGDFNQLLNFFNARNAQEEKLIKGGLRRAKFEVILDKNTLRPKALDQFNHF